MKNTEIITRDLINLIKRKVKKTNKINKEKELLKQYISKSSIFAGEKKKLYRIINNNK